MRNDLLQAFRPFFVQIVVAALLILAALPKPAAAQVTGTGTTNYIPIWTSSSSLGDSVIYQNGSGNVGINTTSAPSSLTVMGHIETNSSYKIGGQIVLALPGGSTSSNTALGVNALSSNTGGTANTAAGLAALTANTEGLDNTATGYQTLYNNTTGNSNTATGIDVLYDNTTGYQNTGTGGAALTLTTGNNNTADVYYALAANTSGSNNIGLGYNAAYNVSGGNSNNIEIGTEGVSGDSATIRIGCTTTATCPGGSGTEQTSFFVAGVRGVTTGDNDAVDVVVDSNGQLGTVSSSRRFKEDIHTWGTPAMV
jgi:hypothetical protein